MITYPTDKLQKVLLGGRCVQNGRPTPDTPMDIVCNNGVLKARHQSGLPLGYTLLEYIESRSQQYIGTGIIVDENTIVELDVQPLVYLNNAIIGTGLENSFSLFTLVEHPSELSFLFGSSSGFKVQVQVLTRNIIKLQLGKVTVNGVEQTYSYRTPSVGKELHINSLSDHSRSDLNRFYRVTIWQGNTLVRNFIPVKRISDNELGMYDTVTDTFFENAGTGTFTAGDPVSDPVEIYTDGTQEVVTDNLGNTATAEMLLKVGNYQDVQSIIDGVVTRNVGVKVLNGTENWQSFITSKFYIVDNVMKARDNSPTLCSHYKSIVAASSAAVNNGQIALFIGGGARLAVCDNNYTTVNDWKQFLAGQYRNGTPVIVVYPLATPTTEQVTPQPLAGSSATVTAGSIDNLPIKSSTIAELKKMYIGDKEVKRVYVGDNLVWENNLV